MPLRIGSTQSVVSSNIKTLVDEWKKDGSIGTSHRRPRKTRSSKPLPSQWTRPAKAAIRSRAGASAG